MCQQIQAKVSLMEIVLSFSLLFAPVAIEEMRKMMKTHNSHCRTFLYVYVYLYEICQCIFTVKNTDILCVCVSRSDLGYMNLFDMDRLLRVDKSIRYYNLALKDRIALRCTVNDKVGDEKILGMMLKRVCVDVLRPRNRKERVEKKRNTWNGMGG